MSVLVLGALMMWYKTQIQAPKYHVRPSTFGTMRSWFSGGPVVKMPHFHCRGCGFAPWLGILHAARYGQKKKKPRRTVSLRSIQKAAATSDSVRKGLLEKVAFEYGLEK